MANPFASMFSKSGDDGWQLYAQFIDLLTAYLAKQPDTSNLVKDLCDKLTVTSGSEPPDLSSLLGELNDNASLRIVIEKFLSEAFPLELVQKDFAKNNHEAARLAGEGEQQFAAGQNEKAIYKFSQALRYAEENLDAYSFEEGNAFADLMASLFDKRSAAFLKAGQQYEAICDIEELSRLRQDALSPSCILRLAHSTTALKDFSNLDKLQSILGICTKAHKSAHLPAPLQAKMTENIEQIKGMIVSLQEQPGKRCKSDGEAELEVLGAQIVDPQATNSAISEKVTIQSSKEKGRHVVASKAIFSGDVLFSETPFSTYSLSELHCANCYRRLANIPTNDSTVDNEETMCDSSTLELDYFSFVPCLTCNKFIFCDAKCRQLAEQFHRTECHRKLHALESHLGVSYIVMRTILVAGGPSKAIEAFNCKSTNCDDSYNSVLSLLTHSGRHDVHSTVSYLLTALFLARSLPRFGISLAPAEEDSILPLLLHHLQQLSTNLVTIFEQEVVGGNSGPSSVLPLPPSKEIPIGIAFYPKIALLNHSCDPDVLPLYIGSKLILKSSRDLAPGSEVAFSYGPTYQKMPYVERQTTLSNNFFFTCQCSACCQRKENYNEAYSCATCNGPAFLDEPSRRLLCSRSVDHVNANVQPILEAVGEIKAKLQAGEQFLKQFEQRQDSADAVAAIVSLHRADCFSSENLFVLNGTALAVKKAMIKAYLATGHLDRALAYAQQLTGLFKKYLNDFLRIPLLQEQLRTAKIRSLLIEEIIEAKEDTEDTPPAQLSAHCRSLETELHEFEDTLAYFESKDADNFNAMFAKEIQFVQEKKSELRYWQSEL